MIAGGGWHALYAVRTTGTHSWETAWDLTRSATLEVICWEEFTSANASPPQIVGWVVSPGSEEPRLLRVDLVTLLRDDDTLKFHSYVKSSEV